MSVPNSREVQEFQFKLLTRLRVFSDSSQLQFDGNLNLVAAASRYGLVFVGTPTGFNIIKVADIVELQATVKKKPSEFCDYSSRRVNLGTQPSHLDVSCDCQLLAVSFILNGAPQIRVYSIASFTSQEIAVVKEVRCDSRVTCMSWNPAAPGMLAVCLASGVAAVYEFSNTSVNISTASDANATCLCWSPKGKQVVIGSSKGTLSQYKPDLKIVKTFQQPNYCSNPLSVISVQWLSSFQFLAVYRDTVDSSERPGVVIVNAPKTGPVTYLNYDDICYSSGTLRDPQFYIIHQQTWNVIMVASGNSMEVGVLGFENDSWVQWIQEDAARADLPLSSSKQETYVVGMAFDTSVQYNLPYGESQTLPPMPLLILLSHEGLLCFFFTVNILQSSAVICSPPEPLSDMSGVQCFVPYSEGEAVEDVHAESTGVKPVITNQPASWLTSPQSVQNNQQKVWSTMTPAAAPSWMTSTTSTPLSQPQLTTMQPPYQKAENENPSAAQVSSAAMWTSNATFAQPNIIQQQQHPVTGVGGQGLTAAANTGTKESTGTLSPQITLNVKPQQSPKLITSRPETETKISEILEPDVIEDSSEDETSKFSDEVIEATIVETVKHFNSDAAELAESIKNINCHIGAPEEKVRFQQSFDNLESFLKELTETTTAQKSEIKSLKSLVFDLFAWIEDARSRVQQLSEHSYTISTELDPVSTRKMNNIEHLLFYTSNQLSQINSYLERNWEETQDIQREKKSYELKTPWMESVFQALALQNNVISKYSLALDEIEKKVDECRNITQLPLNKLSLESDEYSGDNELSKLAESFLEIKLARTGIIPKTEQSPIKHHIKSVNMNKLQKIHKLIINQSITKVQPPKSFMTINVDTQNKETLPGLSLPVTGAKLGGISSGQPVVTTVSKEVTGLHDSKSGFAPTKGSDVSKKTQSGLKNMFDVAQSSKDFGDSVSKTKVAQTYQDISHFSTATKDSGVVTSIEVKTIDTIPDSRFQFTVINPDNNDYVQPVSLTQNSPLATLSNIVAAIPDAQNAVSEGKTVVTKDSKPVLNSDAVAVKNIFAGGITSKPTFGKELDRAKSDLTLLTGSPKITFGIGSSSQDFFKNTTASPEMSKNIFGSSLSPFKSVFGGSPSSSEIPGMVVSKSSTDIKSPKNIPATTANTKNAFVFPELKQIVSTESASTDVNTAKNIFPTKTTIEIPKSTVSQPTTGSGENMKIITPVETSKSVFSIIGSTTKNIFSGPSEFSVVLGDQNSIKSSIGSETGAVKSPLGSKPAVEPPKLLFSTAAAANSTPLNTENSGMSKTTLTSTTGFPKPVSTTVTSTLGAFVIPQNSTASDTETDNKFVPSVPLNSSSIQEEVENPVEEKNSIKDETESTERSENKQNTVSQDTSLSLFGNLSLEQTASTKTGSFGGELPSDLQTENKTNFQNQNISPVTTTSSGPPPSSTSSFSSLLGVQNTSLNNTTSSPPTETVASPVLKAETKTVSVTSDIFSKPVSPVSSTVAEKPTTTQAASNFSFSLPATSGVTQPPFTFSLAANSSDNKAATSSFHFAQPITTTASNITPSSSTFSFGQLASTVTTTVAGDKNTKITLSFGNPQSTPSTNAPMFSGFTTPQTVVQSSLFGQTVSTTSTTNTMPETSFSFTVSTNAPPQNSFFGNKTNLFGTPTTTSASSIFGQPMSSPTSTANSLFGQSTSSVFGQATSPASPFGSSSAFNTKPTFGQSGGSLFGQSSSGGFNTSGTSIFGGSSVFGSSGNASGNLFQTSGTGSIFGGGITSPGGSFSSGGQTISQAGFGSPNAFQNKPAGTFGGAPTFGSAPSFGGAPTFGGSPTFGSPNKVFGATVPATGFGSTQQSTTFENLANQNTMTFGNLAQASSGSAFGGSVFGGNAQQPQSSAFSSGSTSFGGSSFSSWR